MVPYCIFIVYFTGDFSRASTEKKYSTISSAGKGVTVNGKMVKFGTDDGKMVPILPILSGQTRH